jgi:nitrite reductase/ring-hydroxylating ferredoxin subunit
MHKGCVRQQIRRLRMQTQYTMSPFRVRLGKCLGANQSSMTKKQTRYGPSGTHHFIGYKHVLVARSIAGPFEVQAGGRRIVCWNASTRRWRFPSLDAPWSAPLAKGLDSLAFMDNACVHRAAPLCEGWTEDIGGTRTLRCPYHAFAFTSDGRVALVPGQAKVPCGRVQRTYTVVQIGHSVYLTD